MIKSKLIKFSLTRVVTKDIVTDSFQGLRNFLGLRLRGYEKMLNKHISGLIKDMETMYDVSWYRLIVNPLQAGSAMIIVYGKGKLR